MRITIFFKGTKTKQVINTVDEHFLSSGRKDKKGNPVILSSMEIGDKVKSLAQYIAGSNLLDVSYDMPKFGEF